MSVGAVLVGLSWIGSGWADSLRALYAWYVLGGIGAGAVYGASIGLALKWFPDRRGLAAGVCAGAYGLGTALTILPIDWMIEARGYATAFITWGAIQGAGVFVAAQWMQPPPAGFAPPAIQKARAAPANDATPLRMICTSTFWVLYLMMTIVAFGGLMVTAQLKPIAAEIGMDETVVLFGATALGAALVLDRILNGLGRPFWGWVSDRIGCYETMTLAFAVEAVAIFLLLQTIDRPVWFIILSGVVFFGWGAAFLVEASGSWEPVFWVAAGCDAAATAPAFFWLRPLIASRVLGARPQAPDRAEWRPLLSRRRTRRILI